MTDVARVENRGDGDGTRDDADGDGDGEAREVVDATTDENREDGAEEEVRLGSEVAEEGSSERVSRYRILPKLRFRLSVRRRAFENHWRSWGSVGPV